MSLLARVFLPALLLVLPLLSLAPPAAGQPYDTPQMAAAAGRLEDRGIITRDEGRFRVRDRNLLRYYARGIEHLLPAATPAPATV